MAWSIIEGDVSVVLAECPDASFDAVLCDPPYGISYKGLRWDRSVPGCEVWKELFRVVRPGAHLLAFGGSRTWHGLATAIEGAGWEIRDSIAWLYGTGLMRGQTVGGQMARKRVVGVERWGGYRTRLKPAFEPVVVAMRPTEGTFVKNALTHGLAGMNTDGEDLGMHSMRLPANVVIDGEVAEDLAERSVFYYCAKPSSAERSAGLASKNKHPCVKPIALTKHLASLLRPPPRADSPRRILVPYSGSGSEMIGAMLAGWDEVVGIELDPGHVEVAKKRLEHWQYEGDL